MYIYVI